MLRPFDVRDESGEVIEAWDLGGFLYQATYVN